MPVSASSLLCAVVAVILVAGFGQKVYELRRRRDDPVRRAVCLCLAGLAVATIVQLFADAIDDAIGVAHLADVTSDACAMVAAHAGRLFLAHVSHPAGVARVRVRRSQAGLAAALAAVAVLFLACPLPRTEPSPGGRTDAVYFYVYIWYVAVALTSVCRLSTRYARLTDRRPLRAGLRLITAGAVCGLGFLAVQAVMLAGGELGAHLDRLNDAVALPLELTTESLLAAGATAPAWAARLGAVVRWAGDHRAYRRLHPLWLALHEADPELALVPPERMGRRWRRDIGFLLYRQVIEIRDGRLALRPYLDPGVTAVATSLARQAGLPEEEVRVAGEAATVAAGIAAKTQGRRPGPAAAAPVRATGGEDLATEVAWLAKVSRAFVTSPIVPLTLARLAADGEPTG